jgi:hypothetical protein
VASGYPTEPFVRKNGGSAWGGSPPHFLCLSRGGIIQGPLGANMKRPSLVTVLVGAPVLPSIDAEWFASSDKPLAWGELALQDTISRSGRSGAAADRRQ